jgi:hypothetical protein
MHTQVDSHWTNSAPRRETAVAGACSRSARWLLNAATGALLATCVVITGCGSDPGTSDGTDTQAGPLLPYEVGYRWTYRVTEGGVESQKTTTIEGRTLVGGEGYHKDDMAFHVVTRKGQNERDKTESWQARLPDAPDTIVRYREVAYGATSGLPELDESWDKYKLHISGEKVALGQWLEEYKELKINVATTPPTRLAPTDQYDAWTVVNPDEKITVSGKTYEHAVHMTKVSGNGSGEAKHYWYVRGIGKVRETGGQTEELISYQVEAAP